MQKAEDVREVKKLIDGKAWVVSKLEKPSAIDDLEEIELPENYNIKNIEVNAFANCHNKENKEIVISGASITAKVANRFFNGE